MRLLLAEDDDALATATCKYLMRDGHPVDWVTSGNQLLELSARFEYDCVLLDLGLPELSGADCLVNLRAHDNTTPVIVTTAERFLDHRIKLLDLGADDYLVKPYDLAELAARIGAVVRRSRTTHVGTVGRLACGPLEVVGTSSSVSWFGRQISLTAKEFRVLQIMMRRKTAIVTRHQLESEVYGWNETVASNAVEVHIHNLRRKIDSRLIRTLRGVGYQMTNLEDPALLERPLEDTRVAA
jgi:DNA-binding response OmpR family regulator